MIMINRTCFVRGGPRWGLHLLISRGQILSVGVADCALRGNRRGGGERRRWGDFDNPKFEERGGFGISKGESWHGD